MRTWSNTDKSAWGDGEWQDEPDKAHWVDEATGLDCLIVRNNGGALCGYVGVPESHKYFGVDYDNINDIEVHGGLTFASACHDSGDESRHICHPKQGRANEAVWWLGFDCAHSGDLCPKYNTREYGWHEGTYKRISYVKSEVESLARQLVHGETGSP